MILLRSSWSDVFCFIGHPITRRGYQKNQFWPNQERYTRYVIQWRNSPCGETFDAIAYGHHWLSQNWHFIHYAISNIFCQNSWPYLKRCGSTSSQERWSMKIFPMDRTHSPVAKFFWIDHGTAPWYFTRQTKTAKRSTMANKTSNGKTLLRFLGTTAASSQSR